MCSTTAISTPRKFFERCTLRILQITFHIQVLGRENILFSVSYQIEILVLEVNWKKNFIFVYTVGRKYKKKNNPDNMILISYRTKVRKWNHVYFIGSESHENNVFFFIYLLICSTN